jgi:hypothetical protein
MTELFNTIAGSETGAIISATLLQKNLATPWTWFSTASTILPSQSATRKPAAFFQYN